MQTLVETEHKKYIKKFYTLLGLTGGGENAREAILSSYGVDSSKDLSVAQLIEICDELNKVLNPKLGELEVRRKRVIAAISAYHRAMGVDIFQKDYKECTPAEKDRRNRYAKGTAERASGCDFNKIPTGQLIDLYNGFSKGAKRAKSIDDMVSKDLLLRVGLN